MIGAIVGDIVGSVFEFKKPRIKEKNFSPLFQNKCNFTDDTVMTVATMDSILSGKEYSDRYRSYGKMYFDRGFGGMFKEWIQQTGGSYGSYGNGSAMRVSPIGWIFNTEEETLEEAKRSAEVTHDHEEGIKGAQSVALAVYLSRKGSDKETIKKEIEYKFHYNLDRKLDEIRPDYKFDETCQGSVPESIIAFLESQSFEDAIRLSISLGGDADTMACISGSIAEAYYGIPGDIEKQALSLLNDDLRLTVKKFYDKFIH